jgi:CheY-like chemotaxis protein
MNGDLKAKSEYGKGSVFTITLPQKLADAPTNPQTHDFTNMRALIFCHALMNSKYISRCLTDLGVDHHIAGGVKDLEKNLNSGEKWDFIFADGSLAVTAEELARGKDARLIPIMDTHEEAAALPKELAGQGHIIMPAYLLNIEAALTGEHMVRHEEEDIKYFIAPTANVLVVDDIETNLKVAEGLLKQYGLNVSLASSGKQAIDAIKVGEYDIVFMDHMMPEMDGVDATKLIRAHEGDKYKNLPIIALTANAIVGARDMFLANGFSDFISKPIEVEKLNQLLSKWIAKDKQQPVDAPVKIAIDEPPIKIEGVDVLRGLQLSGGNLDNYMYTLRVFHMDGVKKLTELAETLDNMHLYTIHIHALKSAGANIGATLLSEHAGRLEAAGKRGDASYIVRENAIFVKSLREILDAISEVITDGEKDSEHDKEELMATLTSLRQALDAFDIPTVKQATRTLRGYTQYSALAEPLTDILHSVLVSEYEEAEQKVLDFLEKLA